MSEKDKDIENKLSEWYELDWYAIQTYSGSEQSVKIAIENLVRERQISDYLKEVIAPTENIYDITRKSKNKVVKRVVYPGYVFIGIKRRSKDSDQEDEFDRDLLHEIQSLPRVGKFVTETAEKKASKTSHRVKRPVPLTKGDIDRIYQKTLEEVQNKDKSKPKFSFDQGEVVRIVEGPFANFTATVEEYDIEHGKLKLNVSIFGRNTPIEILHSQVEKIV